MSKKISNTYNSYLLTMKTITFTEEQIKLLADAVWVRQRRFIAGDKRFKEYEEMLDNILEGIEYTPSRF